jgi:hypothetical protein
MWRIILAFSLANMFVGLNSCNKVNLEKQSLIEIHDIKYLRNEFF